MSSVTLLCNFPTRLPEGRFQNFKIAFMYSPFNLNKPIAIGSDHAGYDYKEELISFLEARDLAFYDYGTHSKDSADYPDFAHPVADAVEKGEAAFGILLCGSANGVAITANKHKGVRAAICWGEELAKLAREHNDANIICIPARFVREGDAEKMVQLFMDTPFEGGRHQRRVEKIAEGC
jgi:ribose 5-phosphate isomerase B